MRPEVVRQQKRVVLSEVSALLALLRRNAKWSSGRTGQSGSLVHDLKQLRDKARAQVSKGIWATPLEVMMPFLQVVKSTEASGPFTGAALKALLAFLRFGLLDVEDGACLKTRERQAHAVAELVDAVIHCRFEETDAHMDEVVKMTLIELLVEVVEHKAGDLLTDESVWEVVYTCFYNRNEVAHSKMLCYTAEQGLFRIMRVVFRKFAREMKQQQIAAALPHAASGSELASVDSASEGSAGSRSYGLPCTVKIVGFLSSQLLQGFHRSPRSSSAGGGHPYHASTRLVCLRMIREALETGGEGMGACPPLLALVRDDLCLAILKMTKGGYTVEVLCEALALVRCLWTTLRRFLKMQFEVILKSIFLRLLHQIKSFYNPHGIDDGASTSGVLPPPTPSSNMPTDTKYDYNPGEQQIVLETLADLLAEPSVLPDLFFNYDCDTQRTDLLELLTKALADAVKVVDPEALAANGTSSASIDHATTLRALCMDALLIILEQLGSRCVGSSSATRPDDPDVLTAASSSALAGGDLSCMPSGLSLNRITSETWQRKKWKRILQKGSEQFNDKPRLGFKYLVSEGALQHLTPASVATFLRTAPGLDSEAIGKYLGEVGQAEAPGVDAKRVYVSDSVGFHESVLKAFVQTFHFEQQPILTALRMFLAAFRLPGEAQQIDRVLQAFANTAFEVCVESASGIIASADVAYLLSFSIIMLNTDLHNVNIRPEKRMSLDAFIRNNKNYGSDISKGKDLPDEFLETIYKSIAEHPIMPFDDSPDGHMTVDRWRDLIKLAEADSDYGTMVVHEEGDTPTDEDEDDDRSLSSSSTAATTLPPPPRPTTTPDAPTPPQDGPPPAGEGKASCVPATPLRSSSTSSTLSGCRYGAYDREIIQWLWRPFLSSAVKSFVEYDHHTSDPQDPALSGYRTDFVGQSVTMLLAVAKIAAFHQQQEVFDTLVYLLCGFTGLLADPPAHATPDMPWDLQDDEFEGIVEGRRKRDKMLGRLLFRFCNNPAAQTALISAFGIAHKFADSLRAGWRPLLLLLFRLRDLHVLPRDVLRESDADLLSPEGRRALHEAVKARSLRPAGSVGPTTPGDEASAEQANKGGMRWGGSLLNYLFSGGSGLGGLDEREAALLDSPEFEAWDEGARMDESGERRDEQEEGHEEAGGDRERERERDAAEHTQGGEGAAPADKGSGAHEEGPMVLSLSGEAVKDLRQCRALVRRKLCASCKLQDLVGDSRLLRLDSLAHLSKTLIALIHSNLPPGERAAEDGAGEGHQAGAGNGHSRSNSTTTEDALLAALSDEYIARMRREVQLPSLTPASVAFAEVMLAEVALRNRDRITTLWPHMLADHYRTRLSKIRNPTPVTEKVVVGLLRVCIRLFSREGLAEALAESLTWTLPPHLPQDVAVLYSPLLGAGMWRLVTSNPMALVCLPSVWWKPLFDVIQHCAPCGGEATARAFEGLCYVLHEPLLQRCVPVSVVPAVLAFVTCAHSPDPLCRAALDLLMLLHTRLDLLLLLQADPTAAAGPTTMPDAWVSSWGCTLEALATAARDPRLGVRCHALALLTEALLDKQSKRVGATHISRFLAEVAIPLAKSTHTSQAAAAIPNNTVVKKGANYKVGTPPPRMQGMGAQASAFKARELALSLVSQPFLQHLRDLLLLQTFHELWLKVLEVMEVYLADAPPSSLSFEAQQGPGPQGVTAVGTPSSEMAPLSELALEKLKNMLLVMAASGAFEPGEDTIGKELWELTWAVIENFKFCPKLKEDLFGTEQQQAPEAPEQQPPPPQQPQLQPQQQQQYQPEGSSDSGSNQVSPGPNPFVTSEVVSTA